MKQLVANHEFPDFVLSRHASERCQQRGIGKEIVGFLLKVSDQEVPVGKGCSALTISNNCAVELMEDGWSPSLVDRLRCIVAVVNPDGHIITVAKIHSGRRGKIYRRGRR